MSASFRHYGMSPWELEVIYDTLGRAFEVDEVQLQPDDPQYVSMIEIEFPVQYDESFFRAFTMESWFKIKGVIKDVKRRRGRKGVKTYFRFGGSPAVVFPLTSKNDRQFEMGIEKLEYLVDVVPLQLKEIPEKTEEVWFSYDEASFKWGPSVAKSGSVNYVFKNGGWKAISSGR